MQYWIGAKTYIIASHLLINFRVVSHQDKTAVFWDSFSQNRSLHSKLHYAATGNYCFRVMKKNSSLVNSVTLAKYQQFGDILHWEKAMCIVCNLWRDGSTLVFL